MGICKKIKIDNAAENIKETFWNSKMNWDFFWVFLAGYIVGVFHMAYRSNVDSRTTTE